MIDGRLPPPPCVATLGMEFVQIDGERGTVEVKFEAKPTGFCQSREIRS